MMIGTILRYGGCLFLRFDDRDKLAKRNRLSFVYSIIRVKSIGQ